MAAPQLESKFIEIQPFCDEMVVNMGPAASEHARRVAAGVEA